MKITNETYMICYKCGAEARGLEMIHKVFGYGIVKNQMVPYQECRECRNSYQTVRNRFGKPIRQEIGWHSAAGWGKQVNISRTQFDSYLIELGYLKPVGESDGKQRKTIITEKGTAHSAITNHPFKEVILWDYETFIEVVKMRANRAIVHECCPNCCAFIDTMPEYDPLAFEQKCANCGKLVSDWRVYVSYDR